MNIGRAKQIVQSLEKVEVHFQGKPVWIQRLDENDETARVYTEQKPEREFVVSVEELVEK